MKAALVLAQLVLAIVMLGLVIVRIHEIQQVRHAIQQRTK